MLKAVLVLLMVSSCLSNPKHFLIETKDQPGKEPEPSTDWDCFTNEKDYKVGAIDYRFYTEVIYVGGTSPLCRCADNLGCRISLRIL